MSETIDADVLSTLVEHHRRFLEFLEARVGRREVAEDLLQAVYRVDIDRDMPMLKRLWVKSIPTSRRSGRQRSGRGSTVSSPIAT